MTLTLWLMFYIFIAVTIYVGLVLGIFYLLQRIFKINKLQRSNGGCHNYKEKQ